MLGILRMNRDFMECMRKHYNHLTKTTSASDEDKAAAIVKRNEGSNYWASGDKEKCETAYQAAWALID